MTVPSSRSTMWVTNPHRRRDTGLGDTETWPARSRRGRRAGTGQARLAASATARIAARQLLRIVPQRGLQSGVKAGNGCGHERRSALVHPPNWESASTPSGRRGSLTLTGRTRPRAAPAGSGGTSSRVESSGRGSV